MWRRLATLCGVRPASRAPGVSPDPNSAKAESYVTSNGAEKQKEEVLAVTVTSVEDASPNVKLVTLRVHERERFSFRPGQWVDFYAPGVEKPGGYSIASSPGSFARDGTFALAVPARGAPRVPPGGFPRRRTRRRKPPPPPRQPPARRRLRGAPRRRR